MVTTISPATTSTEAIVVEKRPRSWRPRRDPFARGVRVRETRGDRVFVVAAYILLSVFLLVVLLPLLNIIASSLSSPQAVSSGRVLFWPVEFTFRGYAEALGNPAILRGFGNSIFYTVVGTIISVVGTVAIAYPLSRAQLFGRSVITGGVVFTMLFTGGVIPMYLVVQSLGLLDTRWSMFLPNAIGVWQVIIAIVYFRSSVPDEVYEAAQLDGASELRILWTIVVPLAKPLLAVLKGERRDPPPMWLMRQAGRYLPEYRQLRAHKGSFLDLVYDSDAAAEVTLQPLERFAFDAAILFSDILIVPFGIGQNLSFVAGEGPRLTPPLMTAQLDSLTPALTRFERIYETVRKVKARLLPETTLIGFAGAPWTVATYMVAGQGSRDQSETRRLAYADPRRFAEILDRIERVTFDYLAGQIEAGAEAIQVFDSWAGSLAPAQFEAFVIAPTARLVERLRSDYPDVPVIGFPKGAGGKIAAYARETNVDCVGLDETVDPAWAHAELPAGLPVQGNLDPLALLAGGDRLSSDVVRILDAFADRPHIFNLGHGILQDTPIDHVHELVALVKGPHG